MPCNIVELSNLFSMYVEYKIGVLLKVVHLGYNIDLLGISICSPILGKIIVDIYALSRIFKSFNLGYKEKYEPKIPKNIIIYAGDGHCETYRQFLKYMNFKIIEVPKRASNFCISFDGNNIFK